MGCVRRARWSTLTSFSITPAGSMLLPRFSRPGCCFCIFDRRRNKPPALAIEVEKLSTERLDRVSPYQEKVRKNLEDATFSASSQELEHRPAGLCATQGSSPVLQAERQHSKSRIARDEAFHHVQHRWRKRFSSPLQSITPIRRRTLVTPTRKFSPTSSRDIAG